MGWLLLLMGLARAEMPGLHLVALPVAQVSLEAPEGGLGEENLEPLLRVLQGEPLDMADVRQDVALLVQVGAFASVEAWAEPWVLMGEHGEVIDAVRLVYSVRPAPRIQRIEVHGIRGRARRIALEALGLHRGATFFVDDEGEAARQRSESALRRAGWVDARVKLEVVRGDQVHLHVDGGQARVLGEVTLGGDKTMPELRILSWLQAEGVAPGGRRSLANLQAAQKRLERELVAEGWLAARVNMVFFTLEDGRDHLRVLVDAGTRTHFVVEGAPAPRPDELLQVLGLFAGDRVDEGRLGELGRRLERWLDARGHIHGTVRLDLREKEASADQILAIDIFAGARHRLRRLRFEGAEALNQITLAGGVKEAAEETLGKGIVSRAGMDVGLEAIRELYRGQGYLSTDVVLLQLEDGVGQEGEPAVVRTSPLIGIEEGLQTRLAGLSAHGGLGLEDARLAEAEATLVGEAYDPLALDRLAGDIRALYQDQGHLYAEVRLSVDLSASEDLALARVDIQPGEPFRLRSVVIRGNRRTRRGVIAREIGLKLGQPITPTGIAATRSNLYDLDLFRRVQPELVGEDDRARDLLLIVEEKPNILLEAGGGLATDQGVQAKVEATHRNLAGLGHRLSLLGQVGYGWRGDEWRFDTAEPVWRSALRYTAPELTGHHQALFVEGLINETVQAPTWRLSRSGGGLGLRVTPREGREWVVDYRSSCAALRMWIRGCSSRVIPGWTSWDWSPARWIPTSPRGSAPRPGRASCLWMTAGMTAFTPQPARCGPEIWTSKTACRAHPWPCGVRCAWTACSRPDPSSSISGCGWGRAGSRATRPPWPSKIASFWVEAPPCVAFS